MGLQNAAGAQKRGNRVVAALHLGVQAQSPRQIAAALGDQTQIVKGIVHELAGRQQFRESLARRIELVVLIFDQTQAAAKRWARTPVGA